MNKQFETDAIRLHTERIQILKIYKKIKFETNAASITRNKLSPKERMEIGIFEV